MKNRILKVITALCVLFLVIGGILYMSRQHKHKQVRADYDTYMAQLEKISESDEDVLLLPLSDTEEWDTEDEAHYQIWLKAEKAKNYLKQHAPHLVPVEKSADESREGYLEMLRKRDPAAAARLEAQFAQIDRDYEAKVSKLNDTLATWEQELIDHQAETAAWEQERAAWWERFEQDRLERDRFMAKLNERIERLRAELIFDADGNPIGFKDQQRVMEEMVPSGLADTQTPSGAAVPLDVPSDQNVENAPPVPPVSDDPRLWQQTIQGEMARFDVGFYKAYPDVAIRQHLSEAEFELFFPTAEAKRELQQRTEALQSAYAKELDSVLRKMPRQSRQQLLQGVRDDLTQNWDADFAEAVIRQLQQEK